MKKFTVACLVSLMAVSLVFCCFAQESLNPELLIARGKVSSVDWVGSVMAVDIAGDSMVFVVSSSTKITRGTRQFQFSEINQSDDVTVEYYDGGFKGLIAVSISINNPG